MPTAVKENYLKALYHLEKTSGSVNVTELSKAMGVSKPTANNMVKTLTERGWVIYEKYRPVRLTDAGRLAAARVIRKHRLTEMFLHDVMQFGWEEVHEIAEQLEHLDSEKFFRRMDEMLGHPSVDPHGSPIPDREGNTIERDLRPLAELPVGATYELRGLAASSVELLEYLNRLNIELGSRLHLLAREEFDGSCTVRLEGGKAFGLSGKVAGMLLV